MAGDFFEFFAKVNKRASAPAGSATTEKGGKSASAGEPLTVTQLTGLIEKALRDCLPSSIAVKGELSNYKHHGGSGHLYFTLKDAEACIDCVMFRSDAARLRFTPEDGMEMLATGRVAVYGQRGRYQLYVTRLEPLGQGALELAFRQLCAKLQGEGLFAAERKKPIPLYPQRLVLVTSKETAAVQDMLKVLRRFPWLKVMIYHVPVQGDGSAEKIAAAIADVNARAADIGGVDLILLGRGGGSLEDLWEFNEEIVARAIVASRIPIITGIGHEIDVSVADLVADHHAHTPTEAAQVATVGWRTARDELDALGIRLRRELRTAIQQARQRFTQIERHEIFRRPLDRINTSRQLLDDRQRVLALLLSNRLRRWHSSVQELAGRLERYRPAALLMRLRDRLGHNQQNLLRAATHQARLARERLMRVVTAMGERHPRHGVQLARQRLDGLGRQLQRGMSESFRRQRQRVDSLARQLNAVSPQQVLQRGYSITTLKKTGAVVRSVSQVRPGDRLTTQLADGTVETTVEDQRQLRLFE